MLEVEQPGATMPQSQSTSFSETEHNKLVCKNGSQTWSVVKLSFTVRLNISFECELDCGGNMSSTVGLTVVV